MMYNAEIAIERKRELRAIYTAPPALIWSQRHVDEYDECERVILAGQRRYRAERIESYRRRIGEASDAAFDAACHYALANTHTRIEVWAIIMSECERRGRKPPSYAVEIIDAQRGRYTSCGLPDPFAAVAP